MRERNAGSPVLRYSVPHSSPLLALISSVPHEVVVAGGRRIHAVQRDCPSGVVVRAVLSRRLRPPPALRRAPASALDPLWKCCALLALRSQMDPQTPTAFALLTLQWPEVASSPCALQAGRHPRACTLTCGARWCSRASWTPTHTLARLAQASLSASVRLTLRPSQTKATPVSAAVILTAR